MSRAAVTDLRSAQRILIHGVTGSGKTTAAQLIGARLGLPVHLVDEEIGWMPASEAAWTGRPADEMRRLADEMSAAPRWVVDSTYGSFREIVLSRADIIVGLDYPRALSLARLLRRTVGRMIDQRPICNGNRETLRSQLGRDSIIAWHFRSFARKRATMRAWAEDPEGPPTLLVRTPAELRGVLGELARRGEGAAG